MQFEGLLSGHRGWITSLACPQQADSFIKVVSTSRDGTSITWKANLDRHSAESPYGLPDRRFEGHTGFVSAISMAHTTEYAVTASWDRSLRLWDLRTGQCSQKFLGHTNDAIAVAFSADDRHIVSGGRDNKIRVWNVKGVCLHELERDAHQDWVSSLCFSPALDQNLVVSGSWDNTVKVWDLNSGKCVRTLTGHTNYVTSVTVSPDGSLCASGGKDGIVRLWDLNWAPANADDKQSSLMEIPVDAPINQIAFSPNRFWMCVATEKCVRVVDLETKEVVVEFIAESAALKEPECTCLAWSADGTTLYTGYKDNVIRVWSVCSDN